MLTSSIQAPFTKRLTSLLEKEMATHSCVLARIISWTEEPGGSHSMGVTKSRTQLSNQKATTSLCCYSLTFFIPIYKYF